MFHVCLLPLDIPERICFKLQNVQLKKVPFQSQNYTAKFNSPLAETLLKHHNSLLLLIRKKK